jgi:hypothetical protein
VTSKERRHETAFDQHDVGQERLTVDQILRGRLRRPGRCSTAAGERRYGDQPFKLIEGEVFDIAASEVLSPLSNKLGLGHRRLAEKARGACRTLLSECRQSSLP